MAQAAVSSALLQQHLTWQAVLTLHHAALLDHVWLLAALPCKGVWGVTG